MPAWLPAWIRSPHLMMLLMVLIFSVNVIVGRVVVGQVPPFTLSFVRWTAGTLLLLPFAITPLRHDFGRILAFRKRLIICGITMPLIGAGLTYVALTRTVAVNAGIIQTAMPAFTVLLAWIMLGSTISRKQALGMAAAVLGVIVIVMRGEVAALIELELNIGDLILLIATAGLAVYAVTFKGIPAGNHRLSLLVVVFAIGALVHIPFVAVEVGAGKTVALTPTAIFALLFVATLPSVAAIMLWNYGIERLGPGRAGTYMYLNGVFTVFLAYLLLGEALYVYHGIGALLVVFGVWYSERHALN